MQVGREIALGFASCYFTPFQLVLLIPNTTASHPITYNNYLFHLTVLTLAMFFLGLGIGLGVGILVLLIILSLMAAMIYYNNKVSVYYNKD